MLRKYSLIGVIIIFLFSIGCAGPQSIKDMTADYEENSAALREFARITAKDWPLGAGIIMGALEQNQLPALVFTELMLITTWFTDGEGNVIEPKLNDYQLGYIVGMRLKMTGPVIRGAIEQYAPNLLNITEVVALLAFFGL